MALGKCRSRAQRQARGRPDPCLSAKGVLALWLLALQLPTLLAQVEPDRLKRLQVCHGPSSFLDDSRKPLTVIYAEITAAIRIERDQKLDAVQRCFCQPGHLSDKNHELRESPHRFTASRQVVGVLGAEVGTIIKFIFYKRPQLARKLSFP